ncbi:hypothetical protein K503DRAFT_6757 [Rhizopogon vinicolor AM-OR11-026]|uniref:MIT domain-containing protein n=1 Tax=Rhizopogon vinicolor AM-OR11-026 TaxID=1314800 RepID=A0A1B7NJ94_9AGAM|nr:hypothetical protein K503DRAFT_6757 [Rhizopogon vinicolor AM-OR11-026]
MDHEFNSSRPLSIIHRTRQSHDHPSTQSPSSSPVPPPSSFLLAQRRRSSTANFPPAGPPPNQPIPSLPPPSALHHPDDQSSEHPTEESTYSIRHRSSTSGSQYNYGRPAISANLAAIAAFPARQASTSNGPQPSSSSLSHDSNFLSDPPPSHSTPQPTSSTLSSLHHDIVPDRLLLSPTQSRNPSQPRPSSRRALTRALELAREAVQLDSTNDDPHAAVLAYGRSVALLSEVMERVRRGEDTTERTKRNGRRRSVVAQEEEVRRLKSILDIQYTSHTSFPIFCLRTLHIHGVHTTPISIFPFTDFRHS